MQAVFVVVCSVLLVTASAKECGQEELLGCLKSIHLFRFVTDRKELSEVCLDLMNSLACVDNYTQKCMTELQRNHFMHLYSGTITVITEICQEGQYKEEYLQHAPCMREVNVRNEDCAAAYQETIRQNVPSAEASTPLESDAKLRQVCCSFQEYLTCSMTVVMSGCGSGTANFTKHFLDRMARPLVEGHCEKFTGDCGGGSGGGSAGSPPAGALAWLLAPLLATALGRPT